MDAETLLDTLANTLAEVESVTLGKTMRDVKTNAVVDTLSDTVAELEAE